MRISLKIRDDRVYERAHIYLLTGRSLGLPFVEEGMAFARERFRPSRFRLSVVTFNERAIRVYERAGFLSLRTYDHETIGGVHPFLEMSRPA